MLVKKTQKPMIFITLLFLIAGKVWPQIVDAPQNQPWPTDNTIESIDPKDTFKSNLSGLHYQPASKDGAAVLWSVQNDPSRVDRLVWNGTQWAPEVGAWGEGKILTYPDGAGSPDAEGVTKAEWDNSGLYIATERNNSIFENRLSILRYDENTEGKTLIASHEWNLTELLPEVGLNRGLEGITWIADIDLVNNGFFDNDKAKIYDPDDYPNHGTGLFVVALEGNGQLYVVRLNHLDNSAEIIAVFHSGFKENRVMSLEYDRETKLLWAGCDNSCDNGINVLRLDNNIQSPSYGHFVLIARYQPPESLPNSNNEGIALLPEATCSDGEKSFFWADDNNINGHALRLGSVSCGSPLLQ